MWKISQGQSIASINGITFTTSRGGSSSVTGRGVQMGGKSISMKQIEELKRRGIHRVDLDNWDGGVTMTPEPEPEEIKITSIAELVRAMHGTSDSDVVELLQNRLHTLGPVSVPQALDLLDGIRSDSYIVDALKCVLDALSANELRGPHVLGMMKRCSSDSYKVDALKELLPHLQQQMDLDTVIGILTNIASDSYKKDAVDAMSASLLYEPHWIQPILNCISSDSYKADVAHILVRLGAYDHNYTPGILRCIASDSYKADVLRLLCGVEKNMTPTIGDRILGGFSSRSYCDDAQKMMLRCKMVAVMPVRPGRVPAETVTICQKRRHEEKDADVVSCTSKQESTGDLLKAMEASVDSFKQEQEKQHKAREEEGYIRNEQGILIANNGKTVPMNVNDDEKMACTICTENHANALLLPCRHSALCFPCAVRLSSKQPAVCFVCRGEIKKVEWAFS